MRQKTNENKSTSCVYQELNPEMDAFLAGYLEDGRHRGLRESTIHLHDKIGHSGTFYRKPACMFRARPIQEASAFIVSVTILPSIPLRRQNRTDGQRKILCPSCRSILDTMTWMRQKNT